MKYPFECPYCKTKQNYWNEEKPSTLDRTVVVYCDIDEGGCDRELVLDFRVRTETSTRRIEGVAKDET